MINPRREIFNNLAETWDEHLHLTDEKVNTINAVLDTSSIDGSDKILDVGCGTGVLVPFLIERLDQSGAIVGIDLAENMIEKARSKFDDSRIRFVADDVLTLPFDTENFDKIFVFSAFPHFEDKVQTINVFYQLLRKGGLLTIFHVESSGVISNFHQNLETEVLQKDYLPPVDELLNSIDQSNWEVIHAKDQHKLYHLGLRKI